MQCDYLGSSEIAQNASDQIWHELLRADGLPVIQTRWLVCIKCEYDANKRQPYSDRHTHRERELDTSNSCKNIRFAYNLAILQQASELIHKFVHRAMSTMRAYEQQTVEAAATTNTNKKRKKTARSELDYVKLAWTHCIALHFYRSCRRIGSIFIGIVRLQLQFQ